MLSFFFSYLVHFPLLYSFLPCFPFPSFFFSFFSSGPHLFHSPFHSSSIPFILSFSPFLSTLALSSFYPSFPPSLLSPLSIFLPSVSPPSFLYPPSTLPSLHLSSLIPPSFLPSPLFLAASLRAVMQRKQDVSLRSLPMPLRRH